MILSNWTHSTPCSCLVCLAFLAFLAFADLQLVSCSFTLCSLLLWPVLGGDPLRYCLCSPGCQLFLPRRTSHSSNASNSFATSPDLVQSVWAPCKPHCQCEIVSTWTCSAVSAVPVSQPWGVTGMAIRRSSGDSGSSSPPIGRTQPLQWSAHLRGDSTSILMDCQPTNPKMFYK